jgi:hypothetical protein
MIDVNMMLTWHFNHKSVINSMPWKLANQSDASLRVHPGQEARNA